MALQRARRCYWWFLSRLIRNRLNRAMWGNGTVTMGLAGHLSGSHVDTQGLHAGLDSINSVRSKWDWIKTVLNEERPALMGLLEVGPYNNHN